MPRFVLLRHEFPAGSNEPGHWDLMLEDGDALLTWRLLELPTGGGPAVDARRLGDHRLAYLDYEGPISGGRGEVRRSDAGDYAWVRREVGRLEFDAGGFALRGRVVLEELGANQWRLTMDASS